MQVANTLNIVSVISEDKPAMILFYNQEQEAEAKKIKTTIAQIEKSLPLLNTYEFITDMDTQNAFFAEQLELKKTPVLVFFKDGSFHRYKDKVFTRPSITHFIGSSKLYKPQAENTQEEVE